MVLQSLAGRYLRGSNWSILPPPDLRHRKHQEPTLFKLGTPLLRVRNEPILAYLLTRPRETLAFEQRLNRNSPFETIFA